MRCHYDVLGLPLTASSEEIKKSYRKCALQWHPDKHSEASAEKKEEANRRFLEVQDAYETLMEPNDRAWYDSHREILINGGSPGEPGSDNYLYNIFPFFSSTCFKGFGDDERVSGIYFRHGLGVTSDYTLKGCHLP
jgi:DnaJ family protein A protein 5